MTGDCSHSRLQDQHAGCAGSTGKGWQQKALGMYEDLRTLAFGVGVSHWNMIADPAMHSKKDTFVSVVWSWQQGLAAFGDCQLLAPGNTVLVDEANLPDRLAVLAAERRLQRVKTFRQLQAVSHTLSLMTRGLFTLDSFLLPEGVEVRAAQEQEVRVVQRHGLRQQALLFDREIVLFYCFCFVKFLVFGEYMRKLGMDFSASNLVCFLDKVS